MPEIGDTRPAVPLHQTVVGHETRRDKPIYRTLGYRTWTPSGSEEARSSMGLTMDKARASRQRGRTAPVPVGKDYPHADSARGIRRLYGGKLGVPKNDGARFWSEVLCPNMGTEHDRVTERMKDGASTGSDDD